MRDNTERKEKKGGQRLTSISRRREGERIRTKKRKREEKEEEKSNDEFVSLFVLEGSRPGILTFSY